MRRKKPSPPPTTDDLLAGALAEVGDQRARAAKRRARRGRGGRLKAAMPLWKRLVLWLVVFPLAVLLIDGLRREYGEFTARVVSFRGQAEYLETASSPAQPLTDKTALRDGYVVRTGPNSVATLVFPDGSAVELDQQTQFEVRLLDYSRNGKRDRSFLVRSGSAFARVGQYFGVGSEATVCTPTAVAAVRGTAFAVTYDGTTGNTVVQVVEGTVTLRTAAGQQPTPAGQRASSTARYAIRPAAPLRQQEQTALTSLVYQTAQLETPPSGVQRIEWTITRAFDPLLQALGVIPGGWGYDGIDFARRGACMEALRRLRTHIESVTEPPPVLNPVTLAELSLQGDEAGERRRLLDAFAGRMLDSYRILANGSYEVRVRARDKARTPYFMTSAELGRLEEAAN